MVQLSDLTSPQVLILATQLITESDLSRLEILAAERSEILDTPTLYRLLLTFLPTDTDTQSALLPFLQHVSQRFDGISNLDLLVDTSIVEGISDTEIAQRIKELRLGKFVSTVNSGIEELLAEFLIQWVYRTEAATGLSTALVQLVDAFSTDNGELLNWQRTYLLPLWRLQNEFYPGLTDSLTIGVLESMRGETGVQTLLQFAEATGVKAEIGRDLAEVVSPWVSGSNLSKRRRLHSDAAIDPKVGWDDVYHWMYATSQSHFELATRAIAEWGGPPRAVDNTSRDTDTRDDDPHLRYAQAILAVTISSPVPNDSTSSRLGELLQRAIDTTFNGSPASIKKHSVSQASRVHLMPNNLLNISNPISYPSDEAFQLLSTCISTQELLKTFNIKLSIANIVDIALFGSDERQKQELGRILVQIPLMPDPKLDWAEARKQIYHRLHASDSAATSGNSMFYFLGRLATSYIDSEILNAMLSGGQYDEVSRIYLAQGDANLDREQLKKHVIAAIFDAYDNSSNGNRTRGGMKKASDLLRTFRSHFPAESMFDDIDHLIKATHSLSFYSLTLQHGVLFKPVSIRVYHDPIALLEKVLDQNAKAYTKLDDLLEIGRNLVEAGIVKSLSDDSVPVTKEESLFHVAHRVTYLAITAALNDHDFDTAYSYVTTRLSTSPSKASLTPFADDTSWRAAYAAGKYRPAVPLQSVHDRITSLSKRMDLLSLALTLAPNSDPLSEILATWRRSEEEMDGLRAQALEEERSVGFKSSSRNTSALPGGFALEDRDLDLAETRRLHDRRANAGFSPTYEEEAPMGLFDVAKGAASAFRNSAFPLTRGGTREVTFNAKSSNTDNHIGSRNSFEDDSNPQTADQQKTRRKRDVVSGMVTGSLVSGMSWVLGTQPVNDKDEHKADTK